MLIVVKVTMPPFATTLYTFCASRFLKDLLPGFTFPSYQGLLQSVKKSLGNHTFLEIISLLHIVMYFILFLSLKNAWLPQKFSF